MIALLVLGFVGGILPDALRLLSHRYEGAPEYLKSWFFWVCLIALGAMGAGLVAWQRPDNWETAVSLGFTGPEVLRRLLGGSEKPDAKLVTPANVYHLQRRLWSS